MGAAETGDGETHWLIGQEQGEGGRPSSGVHLRPAIIGLKHQPTQSQG